MKNDLMRAYRSICMCGSYMTNIECFAAVVESPAPRFYIDPRRAHLYISPMRHGDMSRIEGLSPLRRQMYEDLFDVVLRLSASSTHYGKCLYDLLRIAVKQPAPRFYIHPKRMEQIWLEMSRETKEKRKELQRRWDRKN